ncbi:MAG: GPW/gp25 family protein [Cyanobacteria bacterium P01_G01_bin.67]
MNLDFSFNFDSLGRTAMSTDDDHIRNMIEQLIFTNPGERVNRPEFGSGLLQLLFAPNSIELAATLQVMMQASLQQYLGDIIDLRDLQVTSEDSKLKIVLQYIVIRTGEERIDTFERANVQ